MKLSFLKKIFLFSLFFFIFFSSGFLDSQDGLQYLTIARRMYFDHTVAMPEAVYDQGKANIHMNTFKAADGNRYAATGIGYSLAMIPAVVVEDILLSLSGNTPLEAFPLQSDWPVLFLASMTNAFFGALLVLYMTKFLTLYSFKEKQAGILSFLFVICTNMFVHTKHSFAHMMFMSFLMMSVYYLKVYFIRRNRTFLLFSSLAFGVVAISYNNSYFFTIPALGLFYLSHFVVVNAKNWQSKVSSLLLDVSVGVLGFLPFYLLNRWYFSFREVNEIARQVKSSYLTWLKPYVLVEGFWGILFSPGKSIFLFSPILLVLILFWFKFDFKKYWKELISFGVLFFTYFFFIGTNLGGEDYLLWHGESSYGNRYMVTPLPFLLILIAFIYKKLSNNAKLFIFYPLLLAGLLVQIPGVLLPYQIRFGGLQVDAYFNGRNFNVYEYGNLIPRYSPVFSMTKKLGKRIIHIDDYFSHGEYNLKFIDGFDYPFDLGWTVWRSIHPKARVTLEGLETTEGKIALQIRNHQINPESTYSAEITVQDKVQLIEPDAEEIIELPNFSGSNLDIQTEYVGTTSAYFPKEQVIFLQALWINDEIQNLKTLDYPYVSPISQSLFGAEYYFWGNEETDPWSIWHMHSGVYEQTFDVWWMRPYHYWDIANEIMYVGVLNGLLVLYLGIKVFTHNSK